MADHRRVAVLGGERDGVQRLGEGADLVDLDEERIGDPAFESLAEPLHVGHEDVVAHQLDA
jgi:hypothetical protein